MKKLFYISFVFILSGFISGISAQTNVYHENFEQPSGADSVTTYSSSSTNTWGISTHLAAGGMQSDSAKTSVDDTLIMTTNAFVTTGNSFVTLDFDHICKIESFDMGVIEVSGDNGQTWTKLDSNHYTGNSSTFGSNGNIFNASAYGGDWSAGQIINPDNTWWKHESFNISSIAGNKSNVKVRFKLVENNGMTLFENYGWLIDNISVHASPSELIPPQITMGKPIVKDTITSSAAQTIKAEITDNSGIDTAYLVYYINGVLTDTLGLTKFTADTFKTDIPFPGFGREVTYFIYARDLATIPNEATTKNYSYYLKYAAGGFVNLVMEESFENAKPSNWNEPTSDQWSRETGGTSSSSTGPSQAHDGSYYLYTEASGNSNSTFSIETHAVDLSGIQQPYLQFYYHMYGSNMGTLHVDVYNGSSWVQNVWTISGNQHNSGSAPWTVANVDITQYKSNSTKIRFRGITGGGYTSDMAIDYIRLGETQLDVPDAGVAVLTNPTGGVVANSNFDVKAKVKNYGGVDLTKFDIGWRLDGNTQSSYNWTGTLNPGNVTPEINLGTKSVTQGPHSLKLWTTNPNDTSDFNLSNDTLHFSFYGCANLLSGSYNIGGTNPDYNTVSDAVLALSQCGINGPVTFNIADGVYNEQISIPAVSGVSASDTVLFQSASGDSSAVTLQYNANNGGDNYVVELDGASYIHFRDLTFKSLDSSYARVFLIKNQAHHLSLAHNRFMGIPVNQGSAGGDSALVFVEDTIGDNFGFYKNRLIDGTIGLDISGYQMQNVNIYKNEFIDQWGTAAAVGGAQDVIIKDNYIKSNSFHQGFNGIVLINSGGDFEISYNEIYADSSRIAYGIQINSCTGDSFNHARVYNNAIAVNASLGATTLSAGILSYESSFVDYYFNTVKMTGDDQNSLAFCIYDLNQSVSQGVKLKNNIFSNFANGYVFFSQNIDTSAYVNDYNNWYADGSGDYANLNGSIIGDLAGWKNATGEAQHSVDFDPYYPGGLDLHINNNLLNKTGTPITGITDDFEGDIRDSSNPDIGADEFDASPYDVALIRASAPKSACGLDSSENVTITIKNVGSAQIDTIAASYTIMGSTAVTVTENIYTTINPGDTLVYTFNQTVNMDITWYGKDSLFHLKSWLDNIHDPVPNNDSIKWDVNSLYEPPAPIVSDTSIDYGTSVTLTATSNDTLHWYAYDTSTVKLYKGDYFKTPQLYDSAKYWVEAGRAKGSPIMITEFSSSPDDIEIQNVTSNSFDATGWQVIICDGSQINNPVTDTWTLGNFAPKEIKMNGDSYGFPQNLAFSNDDWLMIVDDKGKIRDFVASDYSAAEIQSMNVNAGGFTGLNPVNDKQWSGPGVVSSSSFVIRQAYDSNQASDWTSANSGSFNQPNPNMQKLPVFNVFGCPSPRIPVNVTMNDYPLLDAGIAEVLNPKGSILSGVKQPIKLALHNYGQNNLQSADINWAVDGQLQGTYNWTGNIPFQDTDTITIDSMSFKGGVFNLQAWSINPNSANDTVPSNDTASAMFNACMNGIYTIGDTTGGLNYDFTSFQKAMDAMNTAQVCGDVTFEVANGTYTEQLTIKPIPGVNKNHTVTFTSMSGDSTDVILTFQATSSQYNYTVLFDEAEYITFSHMTIEGTGGNAEVVTFEDKSHHISLINNVIDAKGTNSSQIPILSDYGSTNNYNLIKGNRIKNGYYGIEWRGDYSPYEKGNVIQGNVLEKFHRYGMYLYYQDSLFVTGNNVISTSDYYNIYGIYVRYSDRAKITGNKIYGDVQGSFTGIYSHYNDGVAGYPGIIANNFISIKSIGAYDHEGMYLSDCDYLNVYYNSINIIGGNSNSAGVYIDFPSSYGPFNFMNNNIRDSVSMALEVNDAQGVTNMDHNNYYTNSSTGIIAEWLGTAYPTMALLQNASGMDSNSVSIEPSFISGRDLHLIGKKLANKGTPVSGVSRDIDGDMRDTLAPSIGADERILVPYDVGVHKVLAFKDSINSGKQKQFRVLIRNYGLDTVQSVDVKYSIDQQGVVTQTYNQSFPPSATDTVFFPDTAILKGHHDICFYTDLPADTIDFNDKQCRHYYGIPEYDVGVVKLLSPDSGVCYTANERVTIKLINYGHKNLYLTNNPVTVHCSVTGPNPQNFASATINAGIIPSGGTQNVQISSSYDMSAGGLYNFSSYTSMGVDGDHANDSMPDQAIKVNAIIDQFPYSENFETFTVGGSSNDPGEYKNGWSTAPYSSVGNAYQWFVNTGSTPTSSTGPDGDHTTGNGKYVFTEASDGKYQDQARLISPCIDLRSQNNPVLRFWYHMYGTNTYNLRVDVNPGDGWHNSIGFLIAEQQSNSSDPWKQEMVDLSQFAGEIVKIRFRGIRGPGSFGDLAIDDILIYEPNPVELAVKKIEKPDKEYALVGNLEPVEVVVENLGMDTVDMFDIGFYAGDMQPEVETWTGTLNPFQKTTYSFSSPYSVQKGNDPLKVFVNHPDDKGASNDTMEYLITGFGTENIPHYENFEGEQFWRGTGISNQWERGYPTAPAISHPYSGSNVWAVNLDSSYAANSSDLLYTPYFDFSSVQGAKLEFYHWYDTETDHDGGFIQYTQSFGNSWQVLGGLNDPLGTNWYNSSNGAMYLWSGSSSGWVKSGYDLSGFDNAASPVQFRFSFSSDNLNNDNYGWAIDNFAITLPKIPQDAGVVEFVQPATYSNASSANVRVKIVNFGTSALNTIPLQYTVNGGTPVSETWTGSLAAGDTAEYTFSTALAPSGAFTLCAATNVTGDNNAFNDEYCKDFGYDAAVDYVMNPLLFTYKQDTVDVAVRVQNMGSDTLTAMEVYYQVKSNPKITENWTGILAPGKSMIYTFDTSFVSPSGLYQICGGTELSGDTDPSNDESCKYVTGKQKDVSMPEIKGKHFMVGEAYPNPTTQQTTIPIEMNRHMRVRFELYDLRGKLMLTRDRELIPGRHKIKLDMEEFSQGMYYYRLTGKENSVSGKIIRAK